METIGPLYLSDEDKKTIEEAKKKHGASNYRDFIIDLSREYLKRGGAK